jgi:hypothetical protein
VFIRREIDDHLMPSVTAMRDGPKPTNPASRLRSLTVPTPSRFSAITWFRRLWLRVTATAVLGCRVGTDTEFDRAPQHEPGLSNGKKGNTARASEPSAPLLSGGNSAGPDWVSDACNESDRVKLGVAEQDLNRQPACNTMAPPTDATTARNARPPIQTSGEPPELQQRDA